LFFGNSYRIMKTVVIAFLLFCCSFTARCQNYLPFPDSAAVWVNVGWYSGQGYTPGTFFCANGQDTIVNIHSYTRLENCISGDYIGAFRDSLGTVYYVPNDSLNEYIIYDFSANPMDTITYFRYSSGPELVGEAVISWVDTSVYNGTERRVLTLMNGEQWIEGVGSNEGLLMRYFANVSNYAGFLYCMSENDTIHYGVSASGSGSYAPCDFFIGIDELRKETIEVYPNPVEDRLSFDAETQINAILVSNSEGKSIAVDFTRQGDTYSVTLDFLPAGIYQILIKTDLTLYRANVSKQ